MNDKLNEEIYKRIREIAALKLWDIGAIKINVDEPFRLVSGSYSPIYINCRQVISDTSFMKLFTAFAHFICQRSEIKFDVVAGGETAGIPFAASVAQSFSLPMVYVRKKTKDHGVASLVEGNIKKDSVVLLVEDLITDAGSKIHFIEGIKAAGGIVTDVIVLFERLQGGREELGKIGIKLHSLTDMNEAISLASVFGQIKPQDIQSLDEYLRDAEKWCKVRKL
jgi:orotate phosphoribosyltransferase